MSRDAPVPMEVANDLMALALRYDRTGHKEVAASARRGAATIRAMAQVSRPEASTCLLFFLLGAEAEGVVFNGRRAADAFDAAARLLGLDPEFARGRLR